MTVSFAISARWAHIAHFHDAPHSPHTAHAPLADNFCRRYDYSCPLTMREQPDARIAKSRHRRLLIAVGRQGARAFTTPPLECLYRFDAKAPIIASAAFADIGQASAIFTLKIGQRATRSSAQAYQLEHIGRSRAHNNALVAIFILLLSAHYRVA